MNASQAQRQAVSDQILANLRDSLEPSELLEIVTTLRKASLDAHRRGDVVAAGMLLTATECVVVVHNMIEEATP